GAAAGRLADWAQEGRDLLDHAEGIGWAWTHSESTDVQGAAADYLSLLVSFYYYTGGAHPNSHSQSLLVKTGASDLSVVTLAQLFDDAADWQALLEEWVLTDL